MSCFFAYLVLTFFRYTDVLFMQQPFVFIVFGIVVVCAYIVFAHASDILTRAGPMLLAAVSAACSVCGVFLLEFASLIEAHLAGGALAMLGCTIFSLIWGKNLSFYTHAERMPILCGAFLLGSVITALAISLSWEVQFVVSACLPIVSALHLSTFKPVKGTFFFALMKETRKSYKFSVRVLLTTAITGYVWGIAFFIILKPTNPPYIVPLCFALPIALGCIVGFIDSYRFHKLSEESLLRIFSFTSIIAIAPLPFVPSWVQIVCGAYLFLVFSLDTMMCLSAIAETARFNQISPYWVFGISLAYYFSGAFVSYLLFSWAFHTELYLGEVAVCIGSVLLIVFCSDFLFRDKSFPGSDLNTDNMEANKAVMRNEKKPALWQCKIDYVAEKYELTSRQQEVFRILVKGRNAQFVAKEFVISLSTAKAHIHNIYTKLDIHSQQELIDLVENAPIDVEKIFESSPLPSAPPGVRDKRPIPSARPGRE